MGFHDVVTLANWINVLPRSATVEDIESMFKAYKEERLPLVQEAATHSKSLSQVSFTPVRSPYIFIY
jgi:2-polyprenyl-6-methoxyphenol hydroxylase-like FAD-dependent oxidoreductase